MSRRAAGPGRPAAVAVIDPGEGAGEGAWEAILLGCEMGAVCELLPRERGRPPEGPEDRAATDGPE